MMTITLLVSSGGRPRPVSEKLYSEIGFEVMSNGHNLNPVSSNHKIGPLKCEKSAFFFTTKLVYLMSMRICSGVLWYHRTDQFSSTIYGRFLASYCCFREIYPKYAVYQAKLILREENSQGTTDFTRNSASRSLS